MNFLVRVVIACLLMTAMFSASPVFSAEQEKGAIWASSDGKGTVVLFWTPANGVWPSGGWQLERVSGGKAAIIAKHLAPGLDEEAMRAIGAKEASGIRSFSEKLRAGKLSSQEQGLASAVLGLKAMLDHTYGRALGLRFIDREAGSSEVSYRLTGLGSGGAVLQSAKVNPAQPSPLPAPVANLKAVQQNAQVLLSWTMPVQSKDAPSVAFAVERKTSEGTDTLTPKPLLVSEPADGRTASQGQTFLDDKPALETESTYLVYAVDMFGRRSAAGQTGIFVTDATALVPPSQVVAKPGDGRVDVTWKPSPSPSVTGYVVERSMLFDGPFENLTPKGLKRDETSFRDKNVMGGSAYYYRVRSIDPRGRAGHPSQHAMSQPQGADQPPAPEAVKADVGLNRVRITWEPVKYPVAGYFVYRKSPSQDKWFQLNNRLTPEPLYDIHFSEQNGERFVFRVTAVGFDSRESRSSREVEVALPDNLPPGIPQIRGVSGAKGKATIDFVPANPAEDTRQFLVLRGESDLDLGIVIGDPLPASARRYEDVFVDPGKSYWYRVVALDQAGNRSEPTQPAVVLVGTPDIPQPKKPGASFVKAPFEHVNVTFENPAFGMSIVVQVKRGSAGWATLTGPAVNITEAADANPVKGKSLYRVVYQAANGAQGSPSEPVEIEIK